MNKLIEWLTNWEVLLVIVCFLVVFMLLWTGLLVAINVVEIALKKLVVFLRNIYTNR